MVRLLALVIVAIPFQNTASTNLDSLWNVWISNTYPDSVRCKAIDDLIWDGYVYSDPDSALTLANLFYEFAVESNLPKQISNALNTTGICYWVRGDYLEAIKYYERNLSLSNSINNQSGISSSLNNLGAVFHNQGHYPKALQYFKQSLKICEARQDTHGIAVAIGNIGMIYREQEDLEKALSYSKRSLALYVELDEKFGIAKELINIGNILASKGKYEEGLGYYLRSIELRQEINDKRSLISTLEMTGSLLGKMNRFDEAIAYHQRAIKMAKELAEKRAYPISLIELGLTQVRMGEYQKAINNCKEAYDSLLVIPLLRNQRKACNCLYKAYKQLGNEALALAYYEEEQALRDSLQITETAKRLQQMEFEKRLLADSAQNYAMVVSKQNEYNQQIIKEQNLRNIALVSVVFAGLLAFGLYRRSLYINKTNVVLQKERDRSNELLLNILPQEVAEELKQKGESEARDFDNVTVLFTDFQEFTETAEKLSAKELVSEINTCFKAFDGIIQNYQIEKIKTIGDAYMAAGGLHIPRTSEPRDVVKAALEMQLFMIARKAEREAQKLPAFDMRVGIHTGPVVAGIVGVKKFQYDIWGDTVNTASRMESNGEVGKVNISQDTYELLKDETQFAFESRGKVEVKGKGEMQMWFVSNA